MSTTKTEVETETPASHSNFIREIIIEDLQTNKYGGRVHTRFPPEPNGYLHVGHAKSINLNFGLAREFGGKCNLRFDDTNPSKEETEYVDSIIQDVRWLGGDFEDRIYFASDYFDQLYDWAVQLIRSGKAFVCDLSAEEIRKQRGTLTEPGQDSPYRNRSIEESLDLFERMRAAEFPDGSRTLRAKIDMASPNLNLRDPVMYRILHAEHHRTGDKWSIYPMYDFAHGQSDSVERITHSICTLEFEDHRPLYDWYIEQLGIYHPQQIEFDRLSLTYTLLSKRKLLTLVRKGYVNGWDDPRMPTISGMRRRGYTPEALRSFCGRIGVSKTNGTTELGLLEYFVREDLNRRAARVMAVLRPLRVVIDNYPEGQVDELEAVNNPEDAGMGTRLVPFSRVLYIEQDDFREDPPKQYYRLSPGREVRLRWGYFITCRSVIRDGKTGEIVELHCTYDPATRGGNAPDGRKVKSTIHWVSAQHALDAEVRLYETLFTRENPDEVPEGGDFTDNLNPNSLKVLTGAKLEPSLRDAGPGAVYQFERLGYFCVDLDSSREKPVFNRTVALRDAWAKIEKKAEMIILGLGGFINDPACTILNDGTVTAAVEQKKVARRHEPGELPLEAIAQAIALGAPHGRIDCVALVRPFAAGRETDLHLALRQRFPTAQIVLVEHHAAHAASAYYASPFEDAAVLTLDRVGDFRCGARWRGEGNTLRLERELYYPDSLGDLYGRITELLGFHANADEHKVQWLSTQGDGQLQPLFEEVLGLDVGDWPRINRSFFDSDRMSHGGFSARFYDRLGLDDAAPVPPELEAPIAGGLQRAIEAAVLRMAGDASNVCLAGGLGFNALLVHALEQSKPTFVQPMAGNAGTSLGAVLHAWHVVSGQTRRAHVPDLFLGPDYSAEEIKKVLENCKLRFRYLVTTDELISNAVTQINDQKIIAWMQGRMEFGPRALGNRSILASPLNPYSTENLNMFIKHREPFRKFAASVPAELAGEYFDAGTNARFLATVGRVHPQHRKAFEAAILGRDLIRVHTVHAADNPLYHALLHAAGKATGLPVLYNTSFNLFGDPLVCTPRDAVRSFYSSGIDALFAGNFLIEK